MPFYQIGTALPYNEQAVRRRQARSREPADDLDRFHVGASGGCKATGVAPIGFGFEDQFLGGS